MYRHVKSDLDKERHTVFTDTQVHNELVKSKLEARERRRWSFLRFGRDHIDKTAIHQQILDQDIVRAGGWFAYYYDGSLFQFLFTWTLVAALVASVVYGVWWRFLT